LKSECVHERHKKQDDGFVPAARSGMQKDNTCHAQWKKQRDIAYYIPQGSEPVEVRKKSLNAACGRCGKIAGV
ncbi:MAG TPA: hypothetical protein VJM47_04855, partial [Nitrosospira sp.]|nr:hypothetical protein [Nitrosospira sp.]